jgi:hypothetical protein
LSASAEVLIRHESFERFKSLREVIGHQESMQMLLQVVMGLIVILFHRGVFGCAVHPFYLGFSSRDGWFSYSACSSSVNMVEHGCFGPIGALCTGVRFFHFVTLFGFRA